MTMFVEWITPIVKLNLKLQCPSQVFVINDAYILKYTQAKNHHQIKL